MTCIIGVELLKDPIIHKARIKNSADTNSICWIIWIKEPVVKVGVIYFTDIIPKISAVFHPVLDRAGYKRYVLFNKFMSKLNIIEDASNLCIKVAFDLLQLERITGGYFEYNFNAINLCKKLGFVKEGLIRNGTKVNDIPTNIVILGLLRKEFNGQ